MHHKSHKYLNQNLFFSGYGIGSFLGGLFRHVVPLLKRGSIALGKEMLRSSADVVNDITENDVSLKDAVKKRGSEAVKNLKRKAIAKMSGAGVQKSNVVGGDESDGPAKKRKLTKAQSNKGTSRDKTSAEEKAKNKNKNKKKPSAASKSTSEYSYI